MRGMGRLILVRIVSNSFIPKLASRSLSFYSFYFNGRGFIETNYKEEVLQRKVKHNYIHTS